MANIQSFKDAISKARDALFQAGTNAQRAELNIRPHFIPLNFAVLDNMLSDKLIEGYTVRDLRTDIIAYLKKQVSVELVSSGDKLFLSTDPVTPLGLSDIKKLVKSSGALVYEGRSIKGVLYTNFSNAQSFLFRDYLNTVLVNNIKSTSEYKQSFDPGHTAFIQDPQLGTAPQAKKTQEALDTVYAKFYEVYDTLNKTQKSAALRVFKGLSKAEGAFDVHHGYSNKVYSTLSKEFKASLLSITVNIILIQDTTENRGKFSAAERKFGDTVFKVLESNVTKINFSNSLEEEIDQRILNTLTNKKSVNSNSKVSFTLDTKSKTGKVKAKVSAPKLPQPKIRNLETKRLIGLPRLLALLNSHLQDVVSANMQNPSDFARGSRNLLTYRSGRFASSAKVERLTQSKAGLITAFYSYMKYPYATFSQGGRQQYPKTRDPKLLIGFSIREIAAKYVAERLRAVNV